MGRYFRNAGVPAFVLATILAGGALVAWGIVIGFTTLSLIASWNGQQAHEDLRMSVTGRPLISIWTSGRNARTEYLSLDRQPIQAAELFHKKSRNAAFVQPQTLAVDTTDELFNKSLNWIRAYSNGSVPQKYWYLVREGHTYDRAYFVGYDAQTSARVGFLGTGGIRVEKPPLEEQFNLGARSFSGTTATVWAGGTAGTIPNYIGPRDGGGRMAILSNDQLYLVNLATQTVKPVPLAEPAISIGMGNEPVEAEDDLEEEMRITVRTPEHVLVLDWEGETLRTIALPKTLVDKEVRVYLPLGLEVVLAAIHRTDGGYPFTYELYWLDAENHVTKNESVTIAGTPSTDVPVLRSTFCAIPSPAVLATLGYLATSSAAKDVDVSQVRRKLWNESWPMYSLVCLLSVVLAVLAFRRQRRYEPRTAIAWAVFVFLLGPAGLLGYLAHRRWPTLDECAACHARVPRNSENCRSCQTEFPAPALLGGEVFA